MSESIALGEPNPGVVTWLGESMARGRLHQMARRVIGQHLAQEREDLVNTALVRALRGSSSLNVTSEPAIEVWFRRILHNVLIDYLRRRRGGVHECPRSDFDRTLDRSPSAEDVVDARVRKQLVRRRIGRLPLTQQSVLSLVVDKGLSRREIAAELNMRPEAVSMAQTRGVRRLRTSLQSYTPSE